MFLTYSIYFLLSAFFFLLNLKQVHSQQIQIWELDKKATGTISKDDSVDYFQITIPSDLASPNKKILVFTVQADETEYPVGDDEWFSDPDIYVSKTNKYPGTKELADWYCERYGADILSIESASVKANEVFYVGLYCQFKCKYQLKAYLSEEVALDIGKVYSFTIPKKASLNYYFTIPAGDYHEFNVVASSPYLTEFKVFMHKSLPSSQNTFKVLPSWAGGYMISVNKDHRDYCTECKYHVLLQSGDTEEVIVQLYSYFQESLTYVTAGNPIYDSVKENKKRCYAFLVNKANKSDFENIIIQTTLFSGSAVIYVGGWNSLANVEYRDLPSENTDKAAAEYVYKINGERHILLTKDDINYFNSHISSVNERENQYLHYCLYSTQKTSYIISTHFIYQTQELQRYNILLPQIEVTGYLQKGQATRYRILEFTKNANITISFNAIKGEPVVYGYYCKGEKCFFTPEIIKTKLENKSLIHAQATFLGSEVYLPNSENICHNSDDTSIDHKRFHCSSLAVIHCPDEEYCIYKIRVSHDGSAWLMSPKTTYYNLLPSGDTDLYDIVVTDENVESVVIVLNSASGDAEWLVYEIIKGETSSKLIGLSWNDDYIPDVVRITPKRLKRENVVGSYRVKVKSKSFSTYKIYYYTTMKQASEDKPDDKDVTLILSLGQIITDYYPTDIKYKIYSFDPMTYLEEKEDIKIVLTRVGMNFSFKVFKSLSTFNYVANPKSDYQERITGYDWSCDYNKEWLILKTDPKYPTSNIYIVVTQVPGIVNTDDLPSTSEVNLGQFFLGVTFALNPFLLNEGIHQSITLTNSYQRQDYWYLHSNGTQPLEININVYYGKLDLFISSDYLTEEQWQNKKDIPIIKEKITQFSKIMISGEWLKKVCEPVEKEDSECYIYISVRKRSDKNDCQFLISGKSSNLVPDMLFPGWVRTDSVQLHNYHYYIVEEVEKRKGSAITISFYSGRGEIFLRIPDTPENGGHATYPSETNYDYKGKSGFMGDTIEIPAEEYDKLTKDKPKIQFLIAVYGVSAYNHEDPNSDNIEYIISYSSEPKRINQNAPYNSYIQTGEFQYYTFFFDNDVKNIYISISNMVGDADLYLNYGNDRLPQIEKSDWHSSNTNHEFLILHKNDHYFQKNQITEIGGYYTLLVFGYTNTTFTLFVSAQDNPILPISNNSPASCQCNSKDDKCYFQFNDVYLDPRYYSDTEQQIIFTSNYFYGSGVMFASLFAEKDWIENGNFNKFPSEKDHQFSNILSNHRNYMKAKIKMQNNNLYQKDSVLLLTVQCLEKSWMDINMARLEYAEYEYLNANRENIFYIKPSETNTILSYFNSEDKDLIYEIYTYSGSANVLVYINQTYYDPDTKNFTYDYMPLGNVEMGSGQNLISYYNSVKASERTTGKSIHFEIKPYSNFGFFIKWSYSRKWTSVPLGKNHDFYLNNNQWMGYFDITNDFSNVEINVIIENFKYQQATWYVKTNVITKNSTLENHDNFGLSEEAIYNYIIPGEGNFDYKSSNDPVLGSLLVRMSNLPKISDDSKTVRVLFFLQVNNGVPDHDDEDDNDNYDINMENIISVLISPSIDNKKKVESEPFQYYFTNETTYKNVDVKIYDLNKVVEDDDTMIIEISTCTGQFNYKIATQLAADGSLVNEVSTSDSNINGRKIITINNLKSKRYYLSVWPIKSKESQSCTKPEKECEALSEVSYLMYYYTGKRRQLQWASLKASFDYEPYGDSGVKIVLPHLSRDTQGEYTDMSLYKFDAFVSQAWEDYEKMESVCYWAKVSNTTTIKNNLKLISHNNTILIKGLKRGEKYYLNVLAENLKTKELITFTPIIVYAGTSSSNTFILIVSLIAIIIISGVACWYYSKYKKTKDILKYEVNDIRNMTSVPRSESEMSNMAMSSERIKYANLSEQSDNI